MATTANNLIKRVLRRCFWRTDASTGLSDNAPLSDADILAIADEEIKGDFAAQAVLYDGAWFYAEKGYSITADKPLYRLPDRLFGPLIDVTIVDSSGDETSLGRLHHTELGDWPGTRHRTFDHLIQGDHIKLYPTPSTTADTLFLRYHREPGALVLVANALQVVSTDEANKQITFGSDPASLWSVNDYVDVIGNANSQHCLSYDNKIVGISGGDTVTLFESFANLGIAAGDWVVASGSSPVVQLPNELLSAYVKRVAAECLRAAGEREAFIAEDKAANDAWDDAQRLIEDRNDAEPDSIITHNSLIRSRMRYA